MALSTVAAEFWNTDIAEIEHGFLGSRSITDLPVTVDSRAIAQGRVDPHRVVHVDAEVARHLESMRDRAKNANKKKGVFVRFFDFLIFS